MSADKTFHGKGEEGDVSVPCFLLPLSEFMTGTRLESAVGGSASFPDEWWSSKKQKLKRGRCRC